jgi:hypothetical protein
MSLMKRCVQSWINLSFHLSQNLKREIFTINLGLIEILTRVIFCQNVPDKVVLVFIRLLILHLVVVKVVHEIAIAVR